MYSTTRRCAPPIHLQSPMYILRGPPLYTAFGISLSSSQQRATTMHVPYSTLHAAPASPLSPLILATLILLTSIVIIFTIYTIYLHCRPSSQDAATHRQLAGLRNDLSELECRQRKELREQRRWARGYVEERLREYCWLLPEGEGSVGYGTFGERADVV
jgi:hypothetical protein